MTELSDRPVDLTDLELDPDDFSSNPSAAPAFADVVQSRLSRRTVLRGGMLAAAGFMTTRLYADTPAAYAAQGGTGASATGSELLGFTAIPLSKGAEVVVPPGYTATPFIPWGTPLRSSGPAFAPGSPDITGSGNTSSQQAQQVGMHHDGMHYFPLTDDGQRGLLVVNHEYTDEDVLHTGAKQPSGWVGANRERYTLEMVRKSQAAHGVSVVEVERKDGAWAVVDSARSRRVTANTPMTFSGPAAGNRLLQTDDPADGRNPVGTINNCAHGYTPWDTYLTCEENFNGYFRVEGNGFSDEDRELQQRYGVGGDRYNWATQDPRFLVTNKNRNEPNRFGWVVELDPRDPSSVPVKRTALGRLKHEGAFVHVADSGHVVVYMGDDQVNEHAYKFVSERPWKSMVNAGQSPLDRGTLYVARFDDDGSGTWLPLVHGTGPLTARNRFRDQGDVLVKTRQAATLVGATRMDRPEWTTVDPQSGMVYLTLTNNTSSAKQLNKANPRMPNPWGHIIRWTEAGGDHTATTFTWDLFLLAGQGRASGDGSTISEEDAFGSPDGLWADPAGRIWIQTDGRQPGSANNQMLAADPTRADDQGAPEIKRFFTGVPGSEVTGVITTPDQRTMFVNIQHPSQDWPLNDAFAAPRSATVVVTKDDGGVIGT